MVPQSNMAKAANALLDMTANIPAMAHDPAWKPALSRSLLQVMVEDPPK